MRREEKMLRTTHKEMLSAQRKYKQMMNPVVLHYMPDQAYCPPVAVFLFAFAVHLHWARYVTVLPECVQFLYMLVDGNVVNFSYSTTFHSDEECCLFGVCRIFSIETFPNRMHDRLIFFS